MHPTARNGAVIGGLCYLAFCVRADVHRNLQFADHAQRSVPLLESESDSQKVLPKMILERMPFFRTVLFFGALVSAIKSCSSATLLAPATSFVENVLRHLRPSLDERQLLSAMRISIFVFAAAVLTYAIVSEGSSIYEMVSDAYQVTLVGSFVPLTFGLYWRRATTQGPF